MDGWIPHPIPSHRVPPYPCQSLAHEWAGGNNREDRPRYLSYYVTVQQEDHIRKRANKHKQANTTEDGRTREDKNTQGQDKETNKSHQIPVPSNPCPIISRPVPLDPVLQKSWDGMGSIKKC